MNKLRPLMLPAILIVIPLILVVVLFSGRISSTASLLRAQSVLKLQARDNVRKSDLRQIQSALELYRADSGNYPNIIPTCGSSLTGSGLSVATYMQKTPCDPLPSPYPSYSYFSSNSGNAYVLRGCLESSNDKQKDSINESPCNGQDNFSYTLKNP